jgi:uncharacterized protein (TIGR00297 family)
LIAAGAWIAGTLTRSGAAAAWTVGLLVLLGAGWEGGAVLAAFFVSSSVVSRFARSFPGVDPKGDCRDYRQVYANGGLAALCALVGSHQPLALWLVTGTLAAAAADTWATSLGGWSRVPPRLLLTGQRVAPGTSGGVTLVGCAGAIAGAALVAGTGALVSRLALLLPVATLIGFVGMLADSALGAGLQGRFHCPTCDESSEWRRHRCGTPTNWRGGVPWLDNDLVNLLATALAAGLAGGAWAWLAPSF